MGCRESCAERGAREAGAKLGATDDTIAGARRLPDGYDFWSLSRLGLSDENRVSGCDRGMTEGMNRRGKGPRAGWARIQAQPALGPPGLATGDHSPPGTSTEAGVPVPRCWGLLDEVRDNGSYQVPLVRQEHW